MALDWCEAEGWWQADIADDTKVFRGNVRVEGATYRIYRRDTAYELRVWRGPATDRPGDAVADGNPPAPAFVMSFSSLEEAQTVANNLETNRGHFPYDAVENGIGIQFRSDVDGDRYVIIDERDHDMTGWRIEISGRSGERVEFFDRDHRWFCYESGAFDCFGYGGAELREPWSAICDDGYRIVRWLPPDTRGD